MKGGALNLENMIDGKDKKDEDEDIDMVPEDELNLIDNFLDRFVLTSESTTGE